MAQVLPALLLVRSPIMVAVVVVAKMVAGQGRELPQGHRLAVLVAVAMEVMELTEIGRLGQQLQVHQIRAAVAAALSGGEVPMLEPAVQALQS